MNTDLDTRLTNALTDAAMTTHVSDDAFGSIIERTDIASSSSRPTPWILAGGVTAAVALAVTVTVATNGGGSGPPTVAMIQTPTAGDTAEHCGPVTERPATTDEANAVAYLPATLPDGYVTADTPSASVQQRTPSTIGCWTASTTYLDNATGTLLTATISQQGRHIRWADCQLPEDYLPAECVTVDDSPAFLTHEGTRATVGWVTPDETYATVSGYGLSTEQLIATAETVTFDGTTMSIQPPIAMNQLEERPKSRTDNRDFTRYAATFTTGDPTADIVVTVTTWSDVSVTEVGPARLVDVDGARALVVTTGGPGTGITGWTDSNVQAVDQPAGSYITWSRDGLTFHITGPDPDTIALVAQHLQSA